MNSGVYVAFHLYEIQLDDELHSCILCISKRWFFSPLNHVTYVFRSLREIQYEVFAAHSLPIFQTIC